MCSIQSLCAVGLEFIMGLSRVRVAVEDADGYLHLPTYHLANCYVPAQETWQNMHDYHYQDTDLH